MILVLAGTRDGRNIVRKVKEWGYPVMASTLTEYGMELIKKHERIPVIDGGLDVRSLEELVKSHDVQQVIDATHPFAIRISQMAVEVCERMGISYIRYEREQTQIPEKGAEILLVDGFEQAAKQAVKFSGNIFLTIGSNHLKTLCCLLPMDRVIARVLPCTKALEKCQSLGLNPGQIIAMQGPFSKELNMELFRQFHVGVVITKDSGQTGGAQDKIHAARELEIPVIMIRRPSLYYPHVVNTMEQLREWLLMDISETVKSGSLSAKLAKSSEKQ